MPEMKSSYGKKSYVSYGHHNASRSGNIHPQTTVRLECVPIHSIDPYMALIRPFCSPTVLIYIYIYIWIYIDTSRYRIHN